MLGVVARAHVVFLGQRYEAVVDVEIDRAVHVDDLRRVVQRVVVVVAMTVAMAAAMTMAVVMAVPSVVERVDELRAIEHLEDLVPDRAATAGYRTVHRRPAVRAERGRLRIGPCAAMAGMFVRTRLTVVVRERQTQGTAKARAMDTCLMRGLMV